MDEKYITTMANFDKFGGYYPFHSSETGGILGSHIDHSNLEEMFHFANSLLYVHPYWEKKWGGETVLYNKFGTKEIKLVTPKPNRLLLFIIAIILFTA